MYSYTLKRQKRKTLSLQINDDLTLTVKAPFFVTKQEIDKFVLNHTDWLEKKLGQFQEREKIKANLTDEKIAELKEKAVRIIPQRVEYYSHLMGLVPTGVKITSARKRFGSCSGKNSLCFSYILMLYPIEAIDYVVVHELAHIRHHNHSREFYKLIEKYMPDYKQRIKILRG